MIGWSFFCDIAGRVTESDPSSWLTVSAVGIPRDEERSVREELINGLGPKLVKWKYSSGEELKFVVDLVQAKPLPSVSVHIQRTDPEWGTFWKSSREFHSKLTNTTRQKAGFVKGGTVLRYVLFCEAVASLIGMVVREFGAGRVVDSGGLLPLSINLVYDREIEDPESQSSLAEQFSHWAKTSRFRDRLGIAPNVATVFTTEQEEPLLLLPDFIAGAAHTRLLVSKGESSNIDQTLTEAAIELEFIPSRVFRESEKRFSDLYPLAFKQGQVVRSQGRG